MKNRIVTFVLLCTVTNPIFAGEKFCKIVGMKGKYLLIENDASLKLKLKDKFKIVRKLKTGATVIAFAQIDKVSKSRGRLLIYKTRKGVRLKKSDIAVPVKNASPPKKMVKPKDVKIGLLAGMNFNAITNYQTRDDDSLLKISPGASNGWQLGTLFEFPINENFSIRISPQFTSTKSKWDIVQSNTVTTDSITTMRSFRSILFPISMKFRTPVAYVHAGIGYMNIAQSTSKSSNATTSNPESIDSLIDMQDITFHFGIGSEYNISPRTSVFIEGQHTTIPGNMLLNPDDHFEELYAGGWNLISGIVVQL
ncbi:MAG: outer membrane beta-barrel protein [Deferribacteres bacterium]|nr:outer membrane beta-barrel protein [Deferribacteres bacterium]